MIITPSPEIVRLTVMQSSTSATNITHDYNIRQLFENRDKCKLELVFYSYSQNASTNIPVYCDDYHFDIGSNNSIGIVFSPVVVGQSTMLVRLNENKSVVYTSYTGTYSNQLYIENLASQQINGTLQNKGLSGNTYTVGYSSNRLVVDFSNDVDYEIGGSYLFGVWAVGDTTGNAEQVFCTKVPSKNFLAKSTPSLFTVTQDSENTKIYYIACKTSGYTTTLNVTKIIDTSLESGYGSGVSLYME